MIFLMLLPLLVGLSFVSPSPAQALLDNLRNALASGNEAAVQQQFGRAADAEYLLRSSAEHGGLKNIKVCVFPAPPGWGGGQYWAVFHTYRDLEEDHDPVYGASVVGKELKLGPEIPPTQFGPARVASVKIGASIDAEQKKVSVSADLGVMGSGPEASTYRLNDLYSLRAVSIDGENLKVVEATDASVPSPRNGTILRAGSLLIPWTTKAARNMHVEYTGVLDRKQEDHINGHLAYVTAWWVPTLGLLPVDSYVTVSAPEGWTIRSEGNPVPTAGGAAGANQASFHSKFPISFPKITAGKYTLAGERSDGGRTFRVYQFEPLDQKRAGAELSKMVEAAKFYDKNLTAFPYRSYECFEGENYYGIESYSYTILEPSIAVWAVSHEMGHTYFGGLAPCTYLKDCWNEGVTQYVDDVLAQNDSFKTLEGGIKTIDVHRALSNIVGAYDASQISYYRGAYAMRMLDREIGLDKVLAGLRAIVTDRVGKDTTWADLRPYFEQASGQNLRWFWDQWIDNYTFPALSLNATPVGGNAMNVHVRQFGTPSPFRLRFVVRLSDGTHSEDLPVTMNAAEQNYTLTAPFTPTSASLVVLGYALVHTTP